MERHGLRPHVDEHRGAVPPPALRAAAVERHDPRPLPERRARLGALHERREVHVDVERPDAVPHGEPAVHHRREDVRRRDPGEAGHLRREALGRLPRDGGGREVQVVVAVEPREAALERRPRLVQRHRRHLLPVHERVAHRLALEVEEPHGALARAVHQRHRVRGERHELRREEPRTEPRDLGLEGRGDRLGRVEGEELQALRVDEEEVPLAEAHEARCLAERVHRERAQHGRLLQVVHGHLRARRRHHLRIGAGGHGPSPSTSARSGRRSEQATGGGGTGRCARHVAVAVHDAGHAVLADDVVRLARGGVAERDLLRLDEDGGVAPALHVLQAKLPEQHHADAARRSHLEEEIGVGEEKGVGGAPQGSALRVGEGRGDWASACLQAVRRPGNLCDRPHAGRVLQEKGRWWRAERTSGRRPARGETPHRHLHGRNGARKEDVGAASARAFDLTSPPLSTIQSWLNDPTAKTDPPGALRAG